MDSDLALIVGLVVAALAVPSTVSALSDGRRPVAGMLTFLIAAGLILVAMVSNSGGYRFSEIPDVFFGVLARYLP
ncbi:hypothetical protein QEZ52_04700 [Aliisedimentitalea scapharcae]|uniref:50S ribosomal protein L35 n=1 Tax=Aliisedimentitalea scapharcae TaxID=1524259 RepID=A0ABZ2XVE5_9RHOB|nr:hypothetical protein K3727_04595 [Rhodobacteraceae bacterium M382]